MESIGPIERLPRFNYAKMYPNSQKNMDQRGFNLMSDMKHADEDISVNFGYYSNDKQTLNHHPQEHENATTLERFHQLHHNLSDIDSKSVCMNYDYEITKQIPTSSASTYDKTSTGSPKSSSNSSGIFSVTLSSSGENTSDEMHLTKNPITNAQMMVGQSPGPVTTTSEQIGIFNSMKNVDSLFCNLQEKFINLREETVKIEQDLNFSSDMLKDISQKQNKLIDIVRMVDVTTPSDCCSTSQFTEDSPTTSPIQMSQNSTTRPVTSIRRLKQQQQQIFLQPTTLATPPQHTSISETTGMPRQQQQQHPHQKFPYMPGFTQRTKSLSQSASRLSVIRQTAHIINKKNTSGSSFNESVHTDPRRRRNPLNGLISKCRKSLENITQSHRASENYGGMSSSRTLNDFQSEIPLEKSTYHDHSGHIITTSSSRLEVIRSNFKRSVSDFFQPNSNNISRRSSSVFPAQVI